jgi:WhiB family transcriptional regulator, redox-sensing transcriptional regulator
MSAEVDFFEVFSLPAWIDGALCAKVGNAEDWFPPNGGPAEAHAEPIAVCNRCPVRLQCLQWAMDLELREDGDPLGHHSRHGIYGGLTPGQRHRLAKGAS